MPNKDTPNSLRGAAKNKKSESKKEYRSQREDLKQETSELKEKINGNPAVVKAIQKLEDRIRLLEEEVR